MSNVGEGVRVSRPAQEQAFESLPQPIRHVLAHAPFDYLCTGLAKIWKKKRAAGVSQQEFRREIIEKICEDIQKSARKTYGPEHPDAQRSRLERRRA